MPGKASHRLQSYPFVKSPGQMKRKLKPVVPYDFRPTSNDWDEHLKEEAAPGGVFVSWRVTGTRLFYPVSEDRPTWRYANFEALAESNEGLFKGYGLSGFSVGTYHEFLVGADIDRDSTFKMGSVEASFGMATPLAALLFNAYHRGKYFGEWYEIRSLRLIGVTMDEVEAAFLSACALYETEFGVLPSLYPLDEDLLTYFWGRDEEEPGPEFFTAPPFTTNIEPLRFYYSGLAQSDDAGSCIYFYRVLEYFSFFTNSSEVSRLRHDTSLSDAEFSKRVLDLMTREERGPIIKLISSLADRQILNTATSDGLISHATAHHLANGVYELRNSLVHGKYSHGYALHSDSVLEPDTKLTRWRAVLRKMAFQAINQYGRKRL